MSRYPGRPSSSVIDHSPSMTFTVPMNSSNSIPNGISTQVDRTVIVHYPQYYESRAERKSLSRTDRRADDRKIAAGIEHVQSIPGRKDTRRWCRGKVGVPHQTHWVKWFDTAWSKKPQSYWNEICQVCGKKLGYEIRLVEQE
jgi:hypothetical protein